MTKEYLIPEKFLKEIETFLTKDKKSISKKRFNKYVSPEFKEWLEERNIPSKFLSYVHKNNLSKITIPTCPVCGNDLSFTQILNDGIFCSKRCLNSSQFHKDKIKESSLKKYGVEHPQQSEKIKEKIKQTILKRYGTTCSLHSAEIKEKVKRTNLEKYGVEYPPQSEIIKEKCRQTCLEKYGVEHSFQAKEIQEKIKQTCKEKYGVENPSQSQEVKEKIKRTNLERYGVENPFQGDEIKKKIKETNLEKYGVECFTQTEEFKEKYRKTCLEKYGVENHCQVKEIQDKAFKKRRFNHWEVFCSILNEKDIVPLFTKEEYMNDTGRKFKCLVCGKDFVSEGTCDYRKLHTNKDGTYTTLQIHNIYCPYCFKAPYSQKEKEVVDFVRSIYKGEVIENDRTQLNGKELDIFIPALNFAIEFDGDYWHSKESAKEKDERKNQLCEEKGIKLLRIKEEDWDNNRVNIENELKETLDKLPKLV